MTPDVLYSSIRNIIRQFMEVSPAVKTEMMLQLIRLTQAPSL